VICAARMTERVGPGTVHSYEGSAVYDPLGEPGSSPDRGGCMNVLTPGRPIIKKSHSIAANSCLVQIEKWPTTSPLPKGGEGGVRGMSKSEKH